MLINNVVELKFFYLNFLLLITVFCIFAKQIEIAGNYG